MEEYKTHITESEEKLSAIAEIYNTTPEKIKAMNPNMRTFGGFVAGTYVSVGQRIKIPVSKVIQSKSESDVEDNYLKNLEFEQKTRYRCEQVNISNVNGTMSHFTEQKYQFLLEQSLEKGIAKVKQEEHIYRLEPSTLNLAFDFLSQTEYIKNDVLFNLSKESGKIDNILNKKGINKKWLNFRDNEFAEKDFIKRLQQTNPKAVEDLKTMGNKQFALSYELAEEEYRRNLFYFICFDQHLYQKVEEMKKEEFKYVSTIVPPIIIPLEFRYDKISEDNEFLKLRKVSTWKSNPELLETIKNKYDEIHKPFIQYGFTEYKIEFRVRIDFNKKENLVETADLFIREQVADNVENTCEYHLKRLHNHTN